MLAAREVSDYISVIHRVRGFRPPGQEVRECTPERLTKAEHDAFRE